MIEFLPKELAGAEEYEVEAFERLSKHVVKLLRAAGIDGRTITREDVEEAIGPTTPYVRHMFFRALAEVYPRITAYKVWYTNGNDEIRFE